MGVRVRQMSFHLSTASADPLFAVFGPINRGEVLMGIEVFGDNRSTSANVFTWGVAVFGTRPVESLAGMDSGQFLVPRDHQFGGNENSVFHLRWPFEIEAFPEGFRYVMVSMDPLGTDTVDCVVVFDVRSHEAVYGVSGVG